MRKRRNEFTIADAENLMLQCAAFVEKLGPSAQPWLDRAERKYENLRKPKEVDRIKAKLAADRAQDGR